MKKRVIIDCDPGHDDVMAIFSAIAHSEKFEILGYTTVCGNNLLDKVTKNLCNVLSFINVDGSVHKGCAKPLVYDPDPQPIAHGESGLDGPVFNLDPKVKVSDVDAITWMKQMCDKHNDITIIALAPLTNVATLLNKYSEVKDSIECITIMGGSDTKGNIVDEAEFNIYADPHAAQIVFESGIPIVLSPLEICEICSTTHHDIDSLKGTGKIKNLAYEILNFFSQYNRRRNINTSPVFDLVPVMHILHPELFETKMYNITIVLDGEKTRGKTEFSNEGYKNVEVITNCLDVSKYNELFLNDLDTLDKVL